MRNRIRILIALLLVTWGPSVFAADVTIETVLANLSNPSSVATRPGGVAERYEVFVADSGARRIVKMSSNEPNRSTEVATGFPQASNRGERGPAPNPICLLFLDEKHLVVGIAGAPPEVRLYELTDAASSLSADAAKQRVSPELPADASEAPFGNCVGLARTRANDYVPDVLLVALAGSHPFGGVWKVPVRANMLGEMSRLQGKLQELQPTALTVSEQGYVLAADKSSRSVKVRLMFLNPTNGQLVLTFQPELSEITGVAYSPKSGNLYALATAYGKDEQGLFRFDDTRKPGDQRITVTKLADIKRATALAFGPDGALYVTSIGDKAENDDGELLKVVGDL
jgi:hypothetical protein